MIASGLVAVSVGVQSITADGLEIVIVVVFVPVVTTALPNVVVDPARNDWARPGALVSATAMASVEHASAVREKRGAIAMARRLRSVSISWSSRVEFGS